MPPIHLGINTTIRYPKVINTPRTSTEILPPTGWLFLLLIKRVSSIDFEYKTVSKVSDLCPSWRLLPCLGSNTAEVENVSQLRQFHICCNLRTKRLNQECPWILNEWFSGKSCYGGQITSSLWWISHAYVIWEGNHGSWGEIDDHPMEWPCSSFGTQYAMRVRELRSGARGPNPAGAEHLS